MFTSTFVVLALSVSALASHAASHSLRSQLEHARRATHIASACFSGGSGACDCPVDNNLDAGVLINVYPGYQCAYPHGACTWDDKTGALQNTHQTNCPATAPCDASGKCACPADTFGDMGVLINAFTGYQCAYPGGACTWDGTGSLANTHQTNCPTVAKCTKLSTDKN